MPPLVWHLSCCMSCCSCYNLRFFIFSWFSLSRLIVSLCPAPLASNILRSNFYFVPSVKLPVAWSRTGNTPALQVLLALYTLFTYILTIVYMCVHRSCVYGNENTGEQYWSRMQHSEPVPRFAHQLVYDCVNKVNLYLVTLISFLWFCQQGKPVSHYTH